MDWPRLEPELDPLVELVLEQHQVDEQSHECAEIPLPHLRVGWEVKSLKVAEPDFRSQWRRCSKDTLTTTISEQHPLCPCKRCRRHLDDYTTVIAVFAQFYEELSQDEIIKALKWVIHRAKMKWTRVVTVFLGKHFRGCASARRFSNTSNVDVWTPRQIKLALLQALSQIFFSVSGETWRQRRGVPIGGMVCKTLCSVVMGASKTRQTDDQVRWESLGFGGKNDVADFRYVDDTI